MTIRSYPPDCKRYASSNNAINTPHVSFFFLLLFIFPVSGPAAANYPSQLLWGDTHLHTALSGDAFAGGVRLPPEAAYRFAKGEQVQTNSGQSAQLSRPLDFIVLADHGNNLGAAFYRDTYQNNKAFRDSDLGKAWLAARARLAQGQINTRELDEGALLPAHRSWQASFRSEDFRSQVWRRVTANAEAHNQPGKFTAFIGYEWTPSGQEMARSQHRVVIFADGAERANQVLPFTSYDSAHEENLWRYLARYEDQTGGRVISIPHNSNLTGGHMFAELDSFARPLTPDYAKTRARFEPIVEITQIKGDSETHPLLSPDDEFANFERWNNWNGWGELTTDQVGIDLRQQKKRKARFEYVRPALQLGLGLEQKLGVNPFKFGVIGSTDSHTGLATADEANFWGKSAPAEPSELRIFNGRAVFNWQMSASGYAGVWAHENTRKSIFLALQRRETYATTGPRMRIRMFAGFDFDDADLTAPDIAKIGYEKGVPMGGDLLPRSAKDRRSPTFLLSANKDPEGANLDRVQIVKGWIENGNARERVYNAILGGDRRLDSDGKASAVGNSVDQDNATYENNIGQAQLLGIWQDPDFNPEVASVYYMRVLQIPTPRWTLYDKVRYQLKDLAEQIPMISQERAYSSAIWYTPRAKKNNKYGLLPIMENEQ